MIYGFKDNGTKAEVPTKDEVPTLEAFNNLVEKNTYGYTEKFTIGDTSQGDRAIRNISIPSNIGNKTSIVIISGHHHESGVNYSFRVYLMRPYGTIADNLALVYEKQSGAININLTWNPTNAKLVATNTGTFGCEASITII